MFAWEGKFRIRWAEHELILPNTITQLGRQALLRTFFHDTAITLDLGLTSGALTENSVIGDAELNEPSAANGYARQSLLRNTTDWPTVTVLAGQVMIQSKDVIYTPAGGSYDKAITRMFIRSDSTAMPNILFSFSAALVDPLTLLDGIPYTFNYQVYLRG